MKTNPLSVTYVVGLSVTNVPVHTTKEGLHAAGVMHAAGVSPFIGSKPSSPLTDSQQLRDLDRIQRRPLEHLVAANPEAQRVVPRAIQPEPPHFAIVSPGDV